MPLTMAPPWKHPKTGIFWLRRAVPDDLRPLVGKREEKRTLGTRDPAEARIRHIAEMAKLEERWAALRRGQSNSPGPVPVLAQTITLTERQAHERAAWLYRYWLDKYRDNPSEQTFWPTNLYEELWAEPSVQSFDWQLGETQAPTLSPPFDTLKEMRLMRLRDWCLDQADNLLAVRDWVTDEQSRLKLAKAMAGAVQRASLLLERLARGEIDEGAPLGRDVQPPVAAASRKSITFDELLKGWEAEKQQQAKTVYEWSREVARAFSVYAESMGWGSRGGCGLIH